MPTLHEALRHGRERLNEIVGRPDLDALYLLAHTLGRDPAWVLSHAELQLAARPATVYHQAIRRRRQGLPLAYLLGDQEFMGHRFTVDESTLIPRPATEQLAQEIISDYPDGPLRCLDIGTGSGAIAVSLALARPHWYVAAIEPSRRALRIARLNNRRLGSHVRFYLGRYDQPVHTQRFDIIVANLPYLGPREMREPSIQREPRLALVGGHPGGFGAIQHLLTTLTPPRQALYLECLPRHIPLIKKLSARQWPHTHCTPITAGRTRFAVRVTWTPD